MIIAMLVTRRFPRSRVCVCGRVCMCLLHNMSGDVVWNCTSVEVTKTGNMVCVCLALNWWFHMRISQCTNISHVIVAECKYTIGNVRNELFVLYLYANVDELDKGVWIDSKSNDKHKLQSNQSVLSLTMVWANSLLILVWWPRCSWRIESTVIGEMCTLGQLCWCLDHRIPRGTS